MNLTIRVFVFCLFNISWANGKIDYCSSKLTCEGTKNSVCKYGCVPSRGVEAIAPDFTFRNSCLHWHNYYRNEVGLGHITSGGNTAGSNIMAMSYDMDLEFTAACWINYRGQMAHDVCRMTPKFSAGQNLYTCSGRGNYEVDKPETIKLFNKAWFDEYKDTSSGQIDKFAGKPQTGHYTQMVWHNSTHVGCAACFINGKSKGRLVACNYGPAGNYRGRPVYKRGSGASACPKGVNKNKIWPGLCGEIEPWTAGAKEKGNPEVSARGGATGSPKNYKAKKTAHCFLGFANLLIMHLSLVFY